MRYQVRFVDDGSLPSEVEWAFALVGGEVFLFVKQSAIDPTTSQCEALAHAWAAWDRVSAELEQCAG